MAWALPPFMNMRRPGILLFVTAVIVVGLVASGVITVNYHPPSSADAKPFWREKPANGPLPEALRIWVEISPAVRPAVVNISTTEKVKS